jgi:hypothetical protein
LPKTKIIKSPEPKEYKNGDARCHLSPPTIIQLPPDAQEESASTEKIAEWLKLADAVLREKAA